jgi:flagellar motility protein MotE (MotC chaperone)
MIAVALGVPRLRLRAGALSVIMVCFLLSAGARAIESAPGLAEATQAGESVANGPANTCTGLEEADALIVAIRERQTQIDAEDRRISERLQVLALAEEKYAAQLAALVSAEEKLSATIAQADGAAERDINQLTAVYENMKPKTAAEIFNTMDVTFAAGFLGMMNPQAAAAIMSNMSTDAAYSVSLILASRNMNVPAE